MAYYLRGRILTRIDLYDKASADYRKASAIMPTSAFKYLVRSDARSRTNDLKGALTALNKAIELNPNYVLAYAVRSSIYEGTNQRSMALADLNRASVLEPNNHQYIFLRTVSKISTSDLQGAKQDADSAVDKANRTGDSDYAEIYQKYLDLAATQSGRSGASTFGRSILHNG
jgi:tetratricopeptide (TPR) repeat protein